MEPDPSILTKNLEKIPMLQIFLAFRYINSYEDWVGIIRFYGSTKGYKLHNELVDFLLDNKISIKKESEGMFKDLQMLNVDCLLLNNLKAWTIADDESLQTFKNCFLNTKQIVKRNV